MRVYESKASRLLAGWENNLILGMLGPQCTSLATVPAQLFTGEAGRWNFQVTGVLCFVRDASARSHFLRLYDLTERTLVFEQQVYSGMRYNSLYMYFHQFEACFGVVGFNFPDHNYGLEDAYRLACAVKAKVAKLTKTAGTADPADSEQDLPEKQIPKFVLSIPVDKEDEETLQNETCQKILEDFLSAHEESEELPPLPTGSTAPPPPPQAPPPPSVRSPQKDIAQKVRKFRKDRTAQTQQQTARGANEQPDADAGVRRKIDPLMEAELKELVSKMPWLKHIAQVDSHEESESDDWD